jgi:uncharacterized membrane protein
MDGEQTVDARENPLVVSVHEPVGLECTEQQYNAGGTVLQKPNVVYTANAHAEGLGAPVNIKVVVPPSTAPSTLDHDLMLLDEIDKIVQVHSAQRSKRAESKLSALWNLLFCATGLCFCLSIMLGLIAFMYNMSQMYWAEYNHGERSFWITFMFWTGTLLLLFTTTTCLLSIESVYHYVSCTKRQRSMWSGRRFRGAVLLLIAVLFAPSCATIASVLARDDIFVGSRRPDNFAAVNFVGRFVALYTWVLLTAFSSFVLWKIPDWMAGYTREAKIPESKQQAQPAIVEPSCDGVDISTPRGTTAASVLNELACEDDLESDNDAAEADRSSQRKSNALVVAEVYNGICFSVFFLWIMPLVAAACYSHVQCDSNCDRGTCSLWSSTCSACEDNYVGEFCQYAPAYRFDNCRVASHCGTYVRVESTIYGDLDLDEVSLEMSCPLRNISQLQTNCYGQNRVLKMLVVAQEFDERDSATDSCDGAPKYRQATRMVETTTTRNGLIEEPIRADDPRHLPLWLYRRNDYYSSSYQTEHYTYGWTVSNGVDAEHCYGVYYHRGHDWYDYDWSTDHVLIGSFRGGGAYDDKFTENVPTELVWDEAVENTGSVRRYDECFDYNRRCWETTRDAFSVVSSLRWLYPKFLAYSASPTEFMCACDCASVHAIADGSVSVMKSSLALLSSIVEQWSA